MIERVVQKARRLGAAEHAREPHLASRRAQQVRAANDQRDALASDRRRSTANW